MPETFIDDPLADAESYQATCVPEHNLLILCGVSALRARYIRSGRRIIAQSGSTSFDTNAFLR
jgi:hypothetical protein